MTAYQVSKRLNSLADRSRADKLGQYFKTGPGEYGEGDIFIGLRVPQIRKVAKEFNELSLDEAGLLLKSPIHEERLAAIFILIHIFSKGDYETREKVYTIYLNNTAFINNWDIVDASADHIVGAFLEDKDRSPLYELAKSKVMWERRIAIISTFHYINENQFEDSLKIAELLLSDKEDLIHKAVGWMLKEVGKRDISAESVFLKKYYKDMPRTMLRYAIERFPEEARQSYLKGTV